MTLAIQWFALLSAINIAGMFVALHGHHHIKGIILRSLVGSIIVTLFAYMNASPVGMTNTMPAYIALSLGITHSLAFQKGFGRFNGKGVALLWTVFFIGFILSSTALTRAMTIGNILKPIEISEPLFTEIQDQQQRLVPGAIAVDKQSKVINGRLEDGSMMSSMYSLDFNSTIIQVVNGDKVYVTPLTWNGFFKWLMNDYDVIGYAITSASDPDASTDLVTTNPDGSDIKFKVTENGYLSSNLARNVYSQVGSVIIENSYLMLDEERYPFYVSYIVKSVAGFGNYAPDGVVVTNPQTKQSVRYPQDSIPDFIDARAAESTLITNTINWGEYRKGFSESWGSSIKIKPTTYNSRSEMFFIDAKDTENNLAYFTGLEGDNSKNKSLSGMLFIDPITLDSYIYYPQTESQNEMAVMDSVRASLGNLSDKWTPTQPIPYRIFGDVDVWMTPIIPINGSSRKIEAYAYTKIFSTEKSAWDRKLSNAMSKLLTTSSDSGSLANSNAMSDQLEGNVRTIYFIDGSAYLTIYDYEKLVECNHQTNVECRGIKEGQHIDINTIMKSDKESVLVGFNENPITSDHTH